MLLTNMLEHIKRAATLSRRLWQLRAALVGCTESQGFPNLALMAADTLR